MSKKPLSPQMTVPRSKAQGLVYGLFMSVFMTCGMEVYNNAIKLGVNLQPGGFSNMGWDVIAGAASELPLMVPVVFVISNLYGNRLGAKLAGRLIDEESDSSFIRSCIVIACTTLVMCPSMSLFASVLFNVVLAGRPVVELPVIWVGTLFKNFGMALMWNLFAASPLSRICLKLAFPVLREQAGAARPAQVLAE